VHAADETIAFHPFHCDKVFAIEMIVHHGRPTIRKCPLVHRHSFIADATWTLCLPHEQREPVGLRCFVCHWARDTALDVLNDTAAFGRFSLPSERDHELGDLDSPLQEPVEV